MRYWLLILFFFSFGFSMISGISDIKKVDLKAARCDIQVEDQGYYSSNKNLYKFLWFDWENKGNFPIYFWAVKQEIIGGADLVDINYSIVEKKVGEQKVVYTGILIPNYKILCNSGFQVLAGKRIRLLTTAEEVGDVKCGNIFYHTYFSKPWIIEEGIEKDGVYFMKPVLKVVGHGTSYNNSLFKVRFGILFDKDNNLSTLKDNQVVVVCYNLKIGWCGDGVVQTEFGEECDPMNPNNTRYCYPNCRYSLSFTESDKDKDGVPDSVDVDPKVPEDFDDVEDADGIPEDICFGNSCFPKWIVKTNCDTCPCPMADYVGDLWYGDKVRATLRTPDGKKLQGISPDTTLSR